MVERFIIYPFNWRWCEWAIVTLNYRTGNWGTHMITSSNGNIFLVTGTLSPVNSLHKCQWRGPLVLFLICAWTNGWVNYQDAGGFRRNRAHYVVSAMIFALPSVWILSTPYFTFTKKISRQGYRALTNMTWVKGYSIFSTTDILLLWNFLLFPVESYSYMTSVTTANLWRYLPNMNVIRNRYTKII